MLTGVMVDLAWATSFQRRVLTAARHIPWGSTVTYAELASMALTPRAARAAASVMRHNRFPLIIPCHRVVAASGIGGFLGKKAGWGVALKKRLFFNEGVRL
ncbi:MAG: methylated-DNA--[protein]-cysteine S-methyltransferase [Chitinivibrionales bacterium]|nr:methylated-DNA--[protein]-cysteine S-methyltransferase [Chitinivibrionales bacterium]MBD3356379.1 methylated-DNA--[protein]-cysteine S-methyltransferase [Chitinivibrionales bacterium]